jgi:hypothetical protein
LANSDFRIYNVEITKYTRIELIMIRNLLASAIILAASTSAFADVKADIENGATAADLVNQAIAGCAGSSSCQETALAEILAAGVDIDTVAVAAVSAGMSVTTVVKAAIAAKVDPATAVTAATSAAVKAGKSVGEVLAEVKSIPEVPAEVVIAATSKGAAQASVAAIVSVAKPQAKPAAPKAAIPAPFVPAGTEPSSISPAG